MITDFSVPIQQVYADCTDRLIQNIARHFNMANLSPTGSVEWEALKLGELGQITRENIKIIAETIGDYSGMTDIALERTMLEAISKNDPLLLKAVQKGLVKGRTSGLSYAMKNILEAYSSQAKSQLNLVNTTMLNSSQEAARKIVSVMGQNQQALASITQNALNTAAGSTVTGVSTYQEALRSSLKELATKGIVGFVDAQGRKWAADAYASMVVRTTAGNVAREAVWKQCDELGLDLVIVPVNATARELCAPWQGAILSRSGRRGVTTDLYDNKIAYLSLFDTSFGQPAGLFGINCHHTPPDPYIPGLSTQRRQPPPDAVDREQEQAKQRYYERQVRAAKREAATYNAAGDKEAFEEVARQVKAAQRRLKQYCADHGLPVYTDRIQVYGYDRSVAAKVTQAARRKAK